MRVSLALLVLSLAGALAGAWLVGRWAVGVVLVAYSVAVGAYALLRDIPEPAPTVPEGYVESILEQARRAP